MRCPLQRLHKGYTLTFLVLVCMTSYLESMLSLSLQPRDSQYKPNHNTLPCSHMLCSGLDLPQRRPCLDPQDQCDYEIGYSNHGSSLGALVTDEFPLRLENGSTTHPHLTFGFSFFFHPLEFIKVGDLALFEWGVSLFRCGYDQQSPGPHPPPPTAGMLGLSRGKTSISSQLSSLGVTKNVIVHCLSHNGKGFLSIGDELVPSSGVTWTSLALKSTRWASSSLSSLQFPKLETHCFLFL